MRAGGELAYVALGANLGDRDATFAAVIEAIEQEADIVLLAASPVFETAPLRRESEGASDQGPYLNAVIELRAWIAPLTLLGRLQAIEARLGRDRSREPERWGPRPIDLDLLFYGERCIELPELVVPHPRAHERAFVLTPLAEIAPRLLHPLLGMEIAEMAAQRVEQEAVRPWPRPQGWPGGPGDRP